MISMETQASSGKSPPSEITPAVAEEIVKLNSVVVPAVVTACRGIQSEGVDTDIPASVVTRLACASTEELQNLTRLRVPVISFPPTVGEQIRCAGDRWSDHGKASMGIRLEPQVVLQALITFANVSRATSLAAMWLRVSPQSLRELSQTPISRFYDAAGFVRCTLNVPPDAIDDALSGDAILTRFLTARMTLLRPDLQ